MVLLNNRYKLLDYAEKKGMPSIYDLLNKIEPCHDAIAQTDGKTIYINPEEFEKMNFQDQFFIIAHESLHIIYKHTDKTIYTTDKFKDRQLLNICQDVCINEYLLKRLKYRPNDGVFLDTLSQFLRMYGYIKGDLEYHGQLTTTALYNYINGMCGQDGIDKLIQHFGSNSDLVEDRCQQPSLNSDSVKELSIIIKITKETLAKELDMQPEQLDELAEELNDSMYDEIGFSFDDFSDGPAGKGTTTNGKSRKTDEAKVLSKKEIVNYVKTFVGSNAIIRGRSQTYTRPNRRVQSSQYVLKGMKHTKTLKEISIYLDTSGSMSQQFVDDMYLTLEKLYKQVKFKLFTFDNWIHEEKFDGKSPYTGGGTDITSVLKHIKDTNSDVSIMITDCEDNFTLKHVTSDLMVFTNNKSITNTNPKVKLAYWE